MSTRDVEPVEPVEPVGTVGSVGPGRRVGVPGLVRVVGFLACVEVASGILQGYYTPIWKDLAGHLSMRDADVNWFEAAQLVVSALLVPPLARLGDVFGHKRVLLLSTAVTAIGAAILAVSPSFTTFLIGFALEGAYIVWLPMEISIIHRRTAGSGRQGWLTRRAAAVLVGVLELSVIVGAVGSSVLVEATSVRVLLAVPAVAVAAGFVLVLVGVEDAPGAARGRGLDVVGLALVTASLGLVMAGLIAVRLLGPDSVLPWAVIAAGAGVAVPFVRYEARRPEPLVDVRLVARRGQWPVQLTAFLFGVSVLGAQIPLSTFTRTDPAVAGYGLGAGAGFVSVLIGLYVVSMAVGAFSLPLSVRLLGARPALMASAALVAVGYAGWIPFHDTPGQVVRNMAVIGMGSGALIAALPPVSPPAAPPERTGFATGMTSAAKTLGGAIASAVFAIALASTGSLGDPAQGHAPLNGYLIVWAVCAGTALAAAVALALLPRTTASAD